MKKTYISPLCAVFHTDASDHLLVVSNPATTMPAIPSVRRPTIYDDTDPSLVLDSNNLEEEEEEEDWGY